MKKFYSWVVNDASSLRFSVEVLVVEIMILFSMRLYQSFNIIISKMNKIKNSK